MGQAKVVFLFRLRSRALPNTIFRTAPARRQRILRDPIDKSAADFRHERQIERADDGFELRGGTLPEPAPQTTPINLRLPKGTSTKLAGGRAFHLAKGR